MAKGSVRANMTNIPEFIVYTGPMFSSKTSKLLSSLERYKYQHKKVNIYKPEIDDRYSASDVITHGGLKMPAVCVKTGADIIKHLAILDENPHVIAVDEAFMIPGVAETLIWLFRNGYTILVSSLELSAAGTSFAEIEKLMPWATKVEKCSAVCTVCGRDAYYTHKKQTGGDEIEVGGSELYEPRCILHHTLIDMRSRD
jgi:thymidine kinase